MQSTVNFLQGLSFSKANSIGENNMSAPIYLCHHSLFLEKARHIKFRGRIFKQLRFCWFFGGFTWHYLFKKSIRVIAVRITLSVLCIFVIKLYQAETEIGISHKNDMVKMQITLDHDSPRLVCNDTHLSDPPYFSLLSIFNLELHTWFMDSCFIYDCSSIMKFSLWFEGLQKNCNFDQHNILRYNFQSQCMVLQPRNVWNRVKSAKFCLQRNAWCRLGWRRRRNPSPAAIHVPPPLPPRSLFLYRDHYKRISTLKDSRLRWFFSPSHATNDKS